MLVELGKRIRKVRKSKGLTIETLSYMSGVNRNYISDLERGTRNPTITILYKLAEALETDIKNLL